MRNYIQYLKNRINESNLGFRIMEIDLFHLMIQVLEEEGYLEAFFDLERERMVFLIWQTAWWKHWDWMRQMREI